jgi:phosphatidylglycerophosphatase A
VKNQLIKFILKAFGTVFFIGYLPFIPGTFGSLVGVGLFIFLKAQSFYCLILLLLLLIIGFLVCGKLEKALNKKDPSCIVIDEVCGMLLGLSFMPLDAKIIFLGFLFFRILDTLKPYPASGLQNIKGSLGIISDDIVAGLYTNILLQLILKLTP